MKIMWVVNIIMPSLAKEYKLNDSVGGGWLVGLYMDLTRIKDIDLVICCPTDKSNLINECKLIEGTTYYFFERNIHPVEKPKTKERFNKIIEMENPDVIHIWGTEYVHSLQTYEAAEVLGIGERVVISIQGLVSVYAHHYYGGLPERVIKSRTILEMIKKDNLQHRHDDFIKRGEFEKKLLKKVKYIIGRTDWDKACTEQVNNDALYFHCNETLRPSFYDGVWEYEKCEKHSIFFTQSSVPLKGFHILLEAMPLILKEYPDAKIYVTGNLTGLTGFSSVKERLKVRTYDKYLNKKIRTLGLRNRILYMGSLDDRRMKEVYKRCNVFVLSSSIENSPNSLGEAMILGTPVVASHVGGVTSMIKHSEEGFVFDVTAPYMLAYYVCQVFKQEDKVVEMTKKARCHALKTHNPEMNTKAIINVYNEIMERQG